MQVYMIRFGSVPDSVQFDQYQITDIPELVPVHLWLDHTITSHHYISASEFTGILKYNVYHT